MLSEWSTLPGVHSSEEVRTVLLFIVAYPWWCSRGLRLEWWRIGEPNSPSSRFKCGSWVLLILGHVVIDFKIASLLTWALEWRTVGEFRPDGRMFLYREFCCSIGFSLFGIGKSSYFLYWLSGFARLSYYGTREGVRCWFRASSTNGYISRIVT